MVPSLPPHSLPPQVLGQIPGDNFTEEIMETMRDRDRERVYWVIEYYNCHKNIESIDYRKE